MTRKKLLDLLQLVPDFGQASEISEAKVDEHDAVALLWHQHRLLITTNVKGKIVVWEFIDYYHNTDISELLQIALSMAEEKLKAKE